MRTQIQLPDELHRGLKRLAREQEWSLAEAIRRGAELLLRSYSRDPEPLESWCLPDAVPLGGFVSEPEDWRELAQGREP